MKVAITTSGFNLDAPMDDRFGHASKLLIYDSDRDTFHVQGNEQNMNTAQGAGIQTARHLCDEKVDYVITGTCGPKAYNTLRAADIAVCTCTDCTVSDAIEKFKQGELAHIDETTVKGHRAW